MDKRYYIINDEPILIKYIDIIYTNLGLDVSPLTQEEIIVITRLKLNETYDISNASKIRRVI
jgi:hypothetical protein